MGNNKDSSLRSANSQCSVVRSRRMDFGTEAESEQLLLVKMSLVEVVVAVAVVVAVVVVAVFLPYGLYYTIFY